MENIKTIINDRGIEARKLVNRESMSVMNLLVNYLLQTYAVALSLQEASRHTPPQFVFQ